jgi:hypothetical protein
VAVIAITDADFVRQWRTKLERFGTELSAAWHTSLRSELKSRFGDAVFREGYTSTGWIV